MPPPPPRSPTVPCRSHCCSGRSRPGRFRPDRPLPAPQCRSSRPHPTYRRSGWCHRRTFPRPCPRPARREPSRRSRGSRPRRGAPAPLRPQDRAVRTVPGPRPPVPGSTHPLCGVRRRRRNRRPARKRNHRPAAGAAPGGSGWCHAPPAAQGACSGNRNPSDVPLRTTAPRPSGTSRCRTASSRSAGCATARRRCTGRCPRPPDHASRRTRSPRTCGGRPRARSRPGPRARGSDRDGAAGG